MKILQSDMATSEGSLSTKELLESYTYEEEIKELKKVRLRLRRFVIRVIDIIGSVFGIVALLPITLFVLISKIKNKEKGPIFFVQRRIGKYGKTFKMYKYRTMVLEADKILETYLIENENIRMEYKIHKKLKNDPRITKIGNFLRKTSLDEFPQFINVFMGKMSLVGPRPYLPREIEDMGVAYKTIIKCKPGITGLWQISGRSEVTFKDRLELDIEYYNNRTILGDIKILIKTALKIFKRDGAI